MLINSEKKSLFSHKRDDIALIGADCDAKALYEMGLSHDSCFLLSDWLSSVGGNAISLNGDTQTFSIWEQKILLIRLGAKGELKMKSDPLSPSLSLSSPVRDVVSL